MRRVNELISSSNGTLSRQEVLDIANKLSKIQNKARMVGGILSQDNSGISTPKETVSVSNQRKIKSSQGSRLILNHKHRSNGAFDLPAFRKQ